MANCMPLAADSYRQLTEDDVAHIDQYLFRFAKLQDAIGERLLALILEYLQEPNPKGKPFIDILNRLEQLGWLEDKNAWLELRTIRNNIAHQYEDEPELAAEALNTIYAKRRQLEGAYLRMKTLYLERVATKL